LGGEDKEDHGSRLAQVNVSIPYLNKKAGGGCMCLSSQLSGDIRRRIVVQEVLYKIRDPNLKITKSKKGVKIWFK
jgi:hypothetical protein